jgi:hypothetical protein
VVTLLAWALVSLADEVDGFAGYTGGALRTRTAEYEPAAVPSSKARRLSLHERAGGA